MESGTILHLALLKKLSSRHNSFQRQRRTVSSHRSPSCSQGPRSKKLTHKLSLDRVKSTVLQRTEEGKATASSGKYRQKRKNIQKDKGLQQSVSAWPIENQQQVSYSQKLKQDKYQLFPQLTQAFWEERSNRNKTRGYKRAHSKQKNLAFNFLMSQCATIRFRDEPHAFFDASEKQNKAQEFSHRPSKKKNHRSPPHSLKEKQKKLEKLLILRQ